jgi:hypothetical protein
VSSRPDAHLSIVPAIRTTYVPYRPDARQTKASSVQTTWISVRTLICIEKLLFQLASVRTTQQPVRTTLSDRSSFRFSFQNQIWEDYCNRPNDVDSHPDTLLLKASSQFKLNHPDVSLPWSGRASTVRMAILLVRAREALVRKLLAADVRWLGRQCLTVRKWLSSRKDFQRKSRNFGCTVVRPDSPCPPSRRHLYLSKQSPIRTLSL